MHPSPQPHAPMSLDERATRRRDRVREHVDAENRHDLDGIMRTFGPAGVFEEPAWNARYRGLDEVRRYYADLGRAAPDFRLDIMAEIATSEAVVLEVRFTGTHRDTWHGLPGTGRTVDFPLCSVFTFDEEDRIAGERCYYDRATVLRQLGVFFEPDSLVGRVVTPLTHPVTIARALGRAALARRRTPAG